MGTPGGTAQKKTFFNLCKYGGLNKFINLGVRLQQIGDFASKVSLCVAKCYFAMSLQPSISLLGSTPPHGGFRNRLKRAPGASLAKVFGRHAF